MSYSRRTTLILLLMVLAASCTVYAEEFVFGVKHDKSLRSGKGKLIVTEDGIEFQAEKAKDTRRWIYRDIKSVDILSPQRLIIQTYEDPKWKLRADRAFAFEIVEGEITEAVYQFFLTKIDKPITARVRFSSPDSMYQLAVKHRHRLGGCQGTLKLTKDRMVYDTENSEDRRTWFYKDIESMGSSDPFSLRVTSYAETFTFELKERLNSEAYEYLWEQVYRVRVGH